MKVLLIKDVKGLGKAGEVKDVKDGYGHNFLIGKGFAKLGTPAVLRAFEAQQKKLALEKEEEIKKLNLLAKTLKSVSVVVVKSMGANEQLFGSVSKEDIAKALSEQAKIELDKKCLESDHIKAVGKHEVSAKLGHGIHASFIVEVKGE